MFVFLLLYLDVRFAKATKTSGAAELLAAMKFEEYSSCIGIDLRKRVVEFQRTIIISSRAIT